MALTRPTLTQGQVTIRPGTPADLDALLSIRREPGVARWWGDPGPAGRQELASELAGDSDTDAMLCVEIGGELAGAIQFSEVDDPPYRSAALDLFLTARVQGQGHGPMAVRLLARHLFEARCHHRLTIDPAVDNLRAIRCYEKVGFRPVGIMRRYEQCADGSFRDGLLMDLLREDLV